MSVRSDVLLWAQRVLAKGNAPAHQLLEVKDDATAEMVSDAFQKIARMAHPDLHRNGLSPEDLESVTSAYSRVAGAYQEMRSQRMTTTRMRPITTDSQSIATQRMPGQLRSKEPTATEQPAAPSSGIAAQSMSSKALVYYRKAELALRRGDAKGGILQIKMAIAADPASQFLRQALGEIEAELAKKP
ncbi:MAG: hypothetical protein H0T46_10090 [Deltaproteobacteria bacterium]|nr:hypothetical protein [Deltaproteobacteria bacterium]